MRRTEGRIVTNPLVQGPDGIWREATSTPTTRHRGTLAMTSEEVQHVLSSYVPGTFPREFRVDDELLSFGEFTLDFIRRFPHPGTKVATEYRRVDQILLDAEHRCKDGSPRRFHKEDVVTGVAVVPRDLEGL